MKASSPEHNFNKKVKQEVAKTPNREISNDKKAIPKKNVFEMKPQAPAKKNQNTTSKDFGKNKVPEKKTP